MSIRTDRSSGIFVIIIGVLVAGFSFFSLALLTLQRGFASVMPDRSGDGAAEFDAALNAVHGVWITHMPFLLAGGLVLAASGNSIRRESTIARRIAQITAILGYVWIIAYDVACLRIVGTMQQSLSEIPEPMLKAFLWGGAAMTTLVSAFFPTAVLYCLWRPRSQSPVKRGEGLEQHEVQHNGTPREQSR